MHQCVGKGSCRVGGVYYRMANQVKGSVKKKVFVIARKVMDNVCIASLVVNKTAAIEC